MSWGAVGVVPGGGSWSPGTGGVVVSAVSWSSVSGPGSIRLGGPGSGSSRSLPAADRAYRSLFASIRT